MKKSIFLIASLGYSLTSYADDVDLYKKVQRLYDITTAQQAQINAIPMGKQGIPGSQGATGERGLQGEKGDKGEQGLRGAQGERGLQGASGHYSAGDGIRIEGDVIKSATPSYHLGDFYHGGIIFWLDEDKRHGLIASKNDINHGKGVQWRNGDSGNKVTNARADGIGAGEGNTRLIISQQTIDQQTGNFAALMAANYRVLEDGETPCPIPVPISLTCFGAWYLPSAHELALIRANLSQQGLSYFAPDFYWSSTEASSATAWMQNFASGEQVSSNKASTLGQVRAISRF